MRSEKSADQVMTHAWRLPVLSTWYAQLQGDG